MQRPILMSTPMVQAIMDGRKTQTRRIIKPQPFVDLTEQLDPIAMGILLDTLRTLKYKPGDILWVKEMYYAYGIWLKSGHAKSGRQKWRFFDTTLTGFKYHYVDDAPENVLPNSVREKYGWFKRSSLFMPRKACRIRLLVKDVRVERLQDISKADAIAEGIEEDGGGFKAYDIIHSGPHKGEPHPWNCVANASPITSYHELWESINGDGSWKKNPYVWVITFEQIKKIIENGQK